LNAETPILVTDRPSIVLGMATTRFLPVYPVIVTVWLVTV
jgi:hypothetical protein